MTASEIYESYHGFKGTYTGGTFWKKLGLSIQTDKTRDEFIAGVEQHNRVVAFIRKMASKPNFKRFFYSDGCLDYYGVLAEIEGT